MVRRAVTVHVIGLTGGIASGKSTVARMLAERGAAVVDADLLARQIVEPGQPALAELVARFGAAILTPRARSIASGSARSRSPIRAHAPTSAGSRTRGSPPRAQPRSRPGPTPAPASCSTRPRCSSRTARYLGLAGLIVVAATPEVQHARLIARDQLSADDARARIAAQAPLADKLAAATWVIENTATSPRSRPRSTASSPRSRRGSARSGCRAARAHAPTDRRARRDDVALDHRFPAFTARRMIAKLLAAEPDTRLYVLARDKFADEAARLLAALPPATAPRSSSATSATWTSACRAPSTARCPGADLDRSPRRHLLHGHRRRDRAPGQRAGTRTVLDLARDAGRLERVVHWSTAMVSGDRRGTFYEEDLEAGQKFHNAYERTKFEAEKLVRAAMRRCRSRCVRPAIIVGDSRTGEIDKLDGPYYLMVLIATNASGLRLPLLGRGDAPLHLVPIDYVIDAAWHVARSDDAAGKTFHLVDPAPLSARAVFEGVAEHAKTEKPRGHIPRPLARAVLRTPGLVPPRPRPARVRRRARSRRALRSDQHRARARRHHAPLPTAGRLPAGARAPRARRLARAAARDGRGRHQRSARLSYCTVDSIRS